MTHAQYVVAAPLDAGEPFEIRDEITVYDAAMLCGGRHPHNGFLRGGDYDDCMRFLKHSISRDPRGRHGFRQRRSWSIFCDLKGRIERGEIKPVRRHYRPSGELDLVCTVLKISDVVDVVASRGERSRLLRHLQAGSRSGGPVEQVETKPPVPAKAPAKPGGTRGPKRGEVDRYGELDRALFPEMEQLTRDGRMSVHAAALQLVTEGKVRGNTNMVKPESMAKRLAAEFRKEKKLAETR